MNDDRLAVAGVSQHTTDFTRHEWHVNQEGLLYVDSLP
jgi:hypothetical protein